MKIEWAWMPARDRVAEPDNEIVLEGSAPCRVLLLHGLTGTPTEFGYIAHHLHRRSGLSVECRRLVNHGQPIGVLARTSAEEILASARGHLERASARARADGAVLAIGGLSLGAVLSLILAAERPGDIGGVMALSPTLFYDGWNVPWTHRLLPLADWMPGVKRLVWLRESPPYGIRDDALRAKIAVAYEESRLGDDARAAELGYSHFPLALFCEMRHLIRHCIGGLGRVVAPLQVLQAKDDDMTSLRNADFILERATSPRKQLVLLENSYHIITADLDRAEVAQRMGEFCRSLELPSHEV